ncbi:MAG TPA: ethylbenzene dehydrogenase-related protein [candidate division Zixibacteria bacterium]|nr:ethylbenzene dehydrogenase-related protein [candidate division Zixibacteria bacterium]
MRDPAFYRYRLGVRLAHAATVLLLGPLYLTGIRLGSIMGEQPTLEPGSLFDRLAPTGDIFAWHAAFGYILTAVGIFYFAHLLLTDQLRRLTNIFTHLRYKLGKKLFYLTMLFLGATAVLSGITLQLGLFSAPDGFVLMHWLHRYSAGILLLMTIAHIVETIANKESRVNSIFFDPVFPGFVQTRALVLSGILGLTILVGLFMIPSTYSRLTLKNIPGIVEIDGIVNEPQWAEADSVTIGLIGGANFESSASMATVKAFVDHANLYLLLTYSDPDYSSNRHLIKTDTGWIVQKSAYLNLFDESIYWEDQVALSLSRDAGGCAATCHIGNKGAYGNHDAVDDTLDLWVWQAVGTNPVAQADDRFMAMATDSNSNGIFVDNPAAGSTHSNLNEDWRQPYLLDLTTNKHSWLRVDSYNAVPYFSGGDSLPVGAIQPAVLVGELHGDRGDIRAFGRWHDNIWTIEMRRRLRTGSPHDLEINDPIRLNVALFDNARKKHAFHLQAIRLDLEQ